MQKERDGRDTADTRSNERLCVKCQCLSDWCGYDIQRVRDLFRDSVDYKRQRTNISLCSKRYIEMANAHEEARKQEKESKVQEKIEAQRIAKEQATALALEKEKEAAENAEKRKEEEARLREAEEAETKINKEIQEKEEAKRQEDLEIERKKIELAQEQIKEER